MSVALSRLERRLDSPMVRLAAKTIVGFKARARGRNSASVDRAEFVTDHQGTMDALHSALRVGAFDSAQRLAVQLLDANSHDVLDERVLHALLEVSLAGGDGGEALRLARANRSRLLGTRHGIGTLEVLGLEPGPMSSRGEPNLLGLSRRIEDGSLAVDGLITLLTASRMAWLRFPELHLLLSSALWPQDRVAAVRFLNRFLTAHALPYADSAATAFEEPSLAALRFPALPRDPGSGTSVSVLVAAYNAVGTVRYAIDSLLAQTHQQLEVLVGDDTSVDGTWELLQDRYRKEKRVRLFRSARNQGVYNVRNALAREARGQLLTFHDADDFALPTRVAAQVAYLEQHGLAACVASLMRLTAAGRVVFARDNRPVRMSSVSLMLTRAAWAKCGPFRSARFGADLELLEKLRCSLAPPGLGRLRAPLMLALASEQSLTQTAGAEALADGYRAPARRAYSEIVYRCYVLGNVVPEADIRDSLSQHHNWVEPAPLLSAC
jgi:hypothetical protein